ncbi:MAG: phosphatase PAP2 family protein [Methanobacteriota archaeon]|nr:MAG: phosphatase PAP2 family protein [Euryarchaeota archaeon]
MQNINATKKIKKEEIIYGEIPERVLWFYRRGYLNSSQSARLVIANVWLFASVALILGIFQPASSFNYAKPLVYIGAIAVTPIAMKLFRTEFYRIYPLIVFGLLYDIISILQFYLNITPNLSILYKFDLILFGWLFGGEPPSFFFYENHQPLLDILFALIYFSQAFVPFIFFFYYRMSNCEDIPILLWAVAFIGGAAAFFFIFFPTAAPWYVYNFGLDPSKVHALKPEIATAGLWYADQALGTDFFVSFFWTNTQAKFAAFPSLHVGTIALLYFFAKEKNLTFQTTLRIYLLSMIVAVVYLNHHWVADTLMGLLLAFLSIKLSGILYSKNIDETL